MVGTFLTKREMNFNKLLCIMSGVWQPGCGVEFNALKDWRLLFRFYQHLDVEQVMTI
ncbi:hypothetical protein LINGRAHAP2_LOCUS35092 [Linum grandiflorum]